MTDQPISKEEREVCDAVLKWVEAEPRVGGSEEECRAHQAGLKLRRARTPSKPKTLVERFELVAGSCSCNPGRGYVFGADAIPIAREYALEKMRACREVCARVHLDRGSNSGLLEADGAIAKLIEEEGRGHG